MAWRRALVFRKSSSKSMPRGRGRAARRAILRGRQARISLGRRTSTTWPALPRSTRRKAPWAIRRRTAQRAGLVERQAPRASQAMEKRSRALPSRRLCRRRGTRWSSSCFQICAALGFLVFMVRSREEVDSQQLTVHRQEKEQRLNAENTERTEVREERI